MLCAGESRRRCPQPLPSPSEDFQERLSLLLKAYTVGASPVALERGLGLLRRQRFLFASSMKKQPRAGGMENRPCQSAGLRMERDACKTAKKPGAGARPPSSALKMEQWGFQPMGVVRKENRLVPCGSWAEKALGGQLWRNGLHLAMSADLGTDRVA